MRMLNLSRPSRSSTSYAASTIRSLVRGTRAGAGRLRPRSQGGTGTSCSLTAVIIMNIAQKSEHRSRTRYILCTPKKRYIVKNTALVDERRSVLEQCSSKNEQCSGDRNDDPPHHPRSRRG